MTTPPALLAAAVEQLCLEDAPVTMAKVEHAATHAVELPPPTTPSPPVKVMPLTEYDSPADVILRIRSHFIPRIALGLKNHEYRAYLLHSDIQYVWLWQDDDEVIRFIITIGAPRRPGEVNDPTGDGNDDFDAGRKSVEYGYPIYEVYRLPSDLSRKILLEDYGIDMDDGRQYVKKGLVEAFPLDSLVRVVPVVEADEDEVD